MEEDKRANRGWGPREPDNRRTVICCAGSLAATLDDAGEWQPYLSWDGGRNGRLSGSSFASWRAVMPVSCLYRARLRPEHSKRDKECLIPPVSLSSFAVFGSRTVTHVATRPKRYGRRPHVGSKAASYLYLPVLCPSCPLSSHVHMSITQIAPTLLGWPGLGPKQGNCCLESSPVGDWQPDD